MIKYLKDKYYWYNTYALLEYFLSSKKESKILMFGYPKSGNTWLRFLLYNYQNLFKNPEVKETITYERLNTLQNNVMDRGTTFEPEVDYPIFYRTHKIYKSPYNLFDVKIFIHRNPLDTLISAYYFYKNRDIPFLDDPENSREKLNDIDFYVKHKFQDWLDFYTISIEKADIVINYSLFKSDCFSEFSKLVKQLEWKYNEDLIYKSIQFSSFQNVKKMAEEKNQKYGNAPKDGSFKGEFTRSGKESQFKYELKEETINFVLEKFPEFKNLYPNLVE